MRVSKLFFMAVMLGACSPGILTNGSGSETGPELCAGVSCSGHGVCAAPTGTVTCTCDSGYHPQGPQCLADADPCAGQTCSGHGVCMASAGGAACTCAATYHPDSHDPLSCVLDSLCVDMDHDGFGANCAQGDDCNDGDASKWQRLTGYVDADMDGYGHGASMQICSGAALPAGFAPRLGDCDDGNPAIPSTQPCPGATAPKLMSAEELQAIADDTAGWASRKSSCDQGLTDFPGSGYVGFDWYEPILDYAVCYNVGLLLNLPAATVQSYADKILALMEVLSRDQNYGTPDSRQELLAVGDGSTRTFTLRMAPASGAKPQVFLAALSTKSFTYNGDTTTLCGDYCFDVIARISNSAGGPAAYTRGVDYHEGYPTLLHWLGDKHPASGATFSALVADGDFTAVSASSVQVSGTTLTLGTAPTATQAVFVQYMGPNYRQTGNGMGGVESIKPDSHFPMRSMNVGLAWGFDAVRGSTSFTPEARAIYADLLAREVDDYMNTTGMNQYLDDPLSNYYLEGELTGTVTTAFATDDVQTTTPEGRNLKDLARSLLMMAQQALDTHIPGGFGFEGTYTNGSTTDLLRVLSIWKDATGEDLASTLQWTANIIPATIHGIKPDRKTFYDGGDWNDLPAVPLADVLSSFAHYLPDHPMAAFARQALADIGKPVSGATNDYKNAFPLSIVTKGTGAFYARSDWGTGAQWLSMSVGPVFSLGHEHLDRGHITLQRGADYLLKDAGEYGAYDTVPWHNVIGVGDGNAPSQCGGDDDGHITAPKYAESGTFAYAQEDMTKSYCKNTQAMVRTVVYVRPDIVLVHDVAQTDAATKKQFNLNFAGTIAQAGDVFSTTAGGSKLFMRALIPANPTPSLTAAGTMITGANGAFPLMGTNYRVVVSGQATSTFLHLFQLTASGTGQMDASASVESDDGRAEGAAVAAGGSSWVILGSATSADLSGSLAYPLPQTCPCVSVVGDLPARANVMAAIADGGGGSIETKSVTADGNGVVTFTTASSSAKKVTLTIAP